MLKQYGETVDVSANGLAKSPYEYKENYNVGDIIEVEINGISANVRILAVTENWSKGSYGLDFTIGKPLNTLGKQLNLMLTQIRKASNQTSSTDSVMWYTIPTDTEMAKADVTYDTIGFKGECASAGSTFKLYLDDQRNGAKTYHVYFKQLGGTGKLTLTTGVAGAVNLVMNPGTYVSIITVQENGDIQLATATPTNTVESGNNQPVTSDAVVGYSQSKYVEVTRISGYETMGFMDYVNLVGQQNEINFNIGVTAATIMYQNGAIPLNESGILAIKIVTGRAVAKYLTDETSFEFYVRVSSEYNTANRWRPWKKVNLADV